MRKITVSLDDKTTHQMQELAERWGLPEVRHNSAVITRCVDWIWQQEIGEEEAEKGTDRQFTLDKS
jgi:predicted transcriptional regulator